MLACRRAQPLLNLLAELIDIGSKQEADSQYRRHGQDYKRYQEGAGGFQQSVRQIHSVILVGHRSIHGAVGVRVLLYTASRHHIGNS